MGQGQTIGKRYCKIKIVTEKNEVPQFSDYAKRFGFYWGVGYVPYIGQVLSLLNILLIFHKNKRCGHDYIAKTFVVKS